MGSCGVAGWIVLVVAAGLGVVCAGDFGDGLGAPVPAAVQHRQLIPEEDVARILANAGERTAEGALAEHAAAIGRILREDLRTKARKRAEEAAEDAQRARKYAARGLLDRLKAGLRLGGAENAAEGPEAGDQLGDAEAAADCTYLDSPSGPASQLCCFAAGIWRCFPSAVVIGAQKSGTTALFAYLLKHPNVAAPTRKELHFFDVASNWNQGLSSYLSKFPPQVTAKRASKLVTIEASPSYMATQNTCKRIRAVLPTVKLIALVRNPVHRAWSEFQMGLRYRRNEEEVAELVGTHARELRTCLEETHFFALPAQNSSSHERRVHRRYAQTRLLDCVPSELSDSHVFGRAASELARKYEESRTWQREWGDLMLATDEAWLHLWRQHVPGPLGAQPDPGSPTQNETAAHRQFQGAIERDMRRIGACRRTQNFLSCNDNPRPSDLRRDYVWRGLYAKQIHECLRWFPRDQLLVLHQEDLLARPSEVMGRVQAFLGLPKQSYREVTSAEALQNFDQMYPQFIHGTAWNMTSSQEIPTDAAKELRKFFNSHNEELFRVLGQRYEAWFEPENHVPDTGVFDD